MNVHMKMKNSIAITLLMLLISQIAFGAQQSDPYPFGINGGFENNVLAGGDGNWQGYDEDAGKNYTNDYFVSDIVHSGSLAIKVPKGSLYQGLGFGTNKPNKGDKVVMRAWVYLTNSVTMPSTAHMLRIIAQGGPGEIARSAQIPAGTPKNQWVQIETPQVIIPDSATWIQLVINNYAAGSVMYVDDVELIKVTGEPDPSPSPSISPTPSQLPVPSPTPVDEHDQKKSIYITNSGFEDGAEGWTKNSSSTSEVVYGNAKQGNYAYKLMPNTTAWQDFGSGQLKANDRVYINGYIWLDPSLDYNAMPFFTISSWNTGSPSVKTELLRATLPSDAPLGTWVYIEGVVKNNGGRVPGDFRVVQVVIENPSSNPVYFDSFKCMVGIDPGDTVHTGSGTPITWSASKNTAASNSASTSSPLPTPTSTKEAEKWLQTISLKPLNSSESIHFQDMVGHWAKSEVEYLASLGVIKGVGDNNFEPDREINYLEYDLLLQRITDKVTQVLKDGDEIITRQEVVVILIDTLQKISDKFPMQDKMLASNFYDYDNIAKGNEVYVSTAVKYKLINGNEMNMFDPKAGLTRAEVSALLVRFLNLFK